MPLDTYLPVGRGRYFIGRSPDSPAVFYYLSPERHDHLSVGFRTVRQGYYGQSEYSDVIIHNPESGYQIIEDGYYEIFVPSRGCRLVEMRSSGRTRRLIALSQPRLGHFRFIED